MLLLVLEICLALLLAPIALAGLSLAPWVPTPSWDFARINRQLQLGKGSVFYELGCGEGRVCRYIAKANPEARIIGIERALPIYLIARLRQCMHPLSNLRYMYGDVLKIDLSDADAVYTYALIGTVNTKLKPKFVRELRPGCRIVSYNFAMRDWPWKHETEHPKNGRHAPLHVYEIQET